jgi:hypothetical protein
MVRDPPRGGLIGGSAGVDESAHHSRRTSHYKHFRSRPEHHSEICSDGFFPQPLSARWRSNNLSSLFRKSSGTTFPCWSSRVSRTTPHAEQCPEISRSLSGPIWRTSIKRGERCIVILPRRAAEIMESRQERTEYRFLCMTLGWMPQEKPR